MPVIEQAKGIVMAREGCGPEEAFDLLRRASQRANLKVHVLAAFLVEQASGNPIAKLPGSEAGGPARPAMAPSDILAEAGRYRGGETASTAGGVPTVDAQTPDPDQDGDQRLPHPRPETVVVTLPGELTRSNAGQVKVTLAAAFGPGVGTVVADGTPTIFCDSAGVRELVVAHKHAAAAGATFRVVVPHHYLRDRLVRTGLAAYLPVYPTLAEALGQYRLPSGDAGHADGVHTELTVASWLDRAAARGALAVRGPRAHPRGQRAAHGASHRAPWPGTFRTGRHDGPPDRGGRAGSRRPPSALSPERRRQVTAAVAPRIVRDISIRRNGRWSPPPAPGRTEPRPSSRRPPIGAFDHG
jgi:anti-anti-sigma factor